jgi:hypothetical protein
MADNSSDLSSMADGESDGYADGVLLWDEQT